MVFEVIRGRPTPKLGVFGFIWGQNPSIFKRSERLSRRDWSTNCLERSERLRRRDWSTNCFERSESLSRRDRFINRLERSEKLRRKSCPQIASSESVNEERFSRFSNEERFSRFSNEGFQGHLRSFDPSIALSEARSLGEETCLQIASSEARA